MAIFTEQRPGVSSVGQYQMSGQPWATSSFSIPATGEDPVEITFPYVTQWVYLQNTGDGGIAAGFSANGVDSTNNYFVIPPSDGANPLPIFRWRIKSLFLVSLGDADDGVLITAGLTGIHSELRGTDGPNYSGSLGVG